MKIKDFYKYYEPLDPEFREIFALKFPRFYEGTLDIEVRPWDEYAQDLEKYDVNPEIFDSPESAPSGTYARKVMGVSFIESRTVAFREIPPTQDLFIHEIGHVHFKVGEIPWNRTYGGAETLFWLIWHGKINVDDPDEALSVYVEAMKVAHEGTEEDKRALLDKVVAGIAKRFGIEPPHLAAIYARMGVLPQHSFRNFDLRAFHQDPEQLEPDYKKEPFEFLSNLMESARWDDAGVLLLPVAIEACKLFLKEKEGGRG